MERDVDKIYKIFEQLDNESFERMISLLAKYFYKENKKCFIDEYSSYSICDMLETISNESLNEVMYQVYKSIASDNFFDRIKKVEEIIKNKSENTQYSNMIIDEDGNRNLPQYYEFGVAKYALSDCIEALTNNGAKEVIVTKVDDDLVVRYKPYWKE